MKRSPTKPRDRRRHWNAVAARLLMGFLLLASSASLDAAETVTEKSDQIRQIEEELSREREQYVKFDVKEKNLLGQLAEIEKRIAEKRELVEKLETKIQPQRIELEKMRNRLQGFEAKIRTVRDRLGSKLVAYYKYARRGYVQLLATSKDLDDLRKRMYYLRILMGKDRERLEGMLHVLRSHREQVSAVEEKVHVVSRLEDEEERKAASLEKEIEKKVLLLMKIHREKEFYETAVQELEAAARNLKDTLANLETGTEKRSELTSDFSDYKGMLPLPYEGKIIRDYHPLGTGPVMTHRGIFIQGKAGGDVKAIYDGRVDYSGWLKGYGQILIINHGSRFFSVSAHLSERKREEGDVVRKGDVIASAGDTESLSGPGLYFELRKGGESLDPLAWIKVR